MDSEMLRLDMCGALDALATLVNSQKEHTVVNQQDLACMLRLLSHCAHQAIIPEEDDITLDPAMARH